MTRSSQKPTRSTFAAGGDVKAKWITERSRLWQEAWTRDDQALLRTISGSEEDEEESEESEESEEEEEDEEANRFLHPTAASRKEAFAYFGKLFYCKYRGKLMRVRVVEEAKTGMKDPQKNSYDCIFLHTDTLCELTVAQLLDAKEVDQPADTVEEEVIFRNEYDQSDEDEED